MFKRFFPLKYFLAILVLIILVFSFLVTIKKQNLSPESSFKTYSDQFIIEQTSRIDFENNYLFLNDKLYIDPHVNPDIEQNTHLIIYEFLPGKPYKTNTISLLVDKDGTVEISNWDHDYNLPSCELDLYKCEFKLSPQKLKEISLEQGIPEKFEPYLVMYKDQVVFKFVDCGIGWGGNKRQSIYINTQTGKILNK